MLKNERAHSLWRAFEPCFGIQNIVPFQVCSCLGEEEARESSLHYFSSLSDVP